MAESGRAQAARSAPLYPNSIGYCIKKYGYTRSELAQEIGIDRKTLYLYCCGRLPTPRYTLAKIARTLGCSVEELTAPPAVADRGMAAATVPGDQTTICEVVVVSPESSITPALHAADAFQNSLALPSQIIAQSIAGAIHELEGTAPLDLSRREVLQYLLHLAGITAIAPALHAGPEMWPQLFANPHDPIRSSEVGPETLESFAALTEICRHLSEGNELKAAERILWAYLPRVETIAKLSFEHQQRAASLASQGYLLAASLAGQHNNLQTRHYFSEQALLYGKLARDRSLQITALRQLSITYDYMARPEKVLQVFQQASPYLREVSPLLQACVYAGAAGAYAQLKQEQEALRFMGLAYEHFPANPGQEPGYVHTICRYSSLVFFDGLNHLELGRPHEAEKVLARIDGLHPKIPIPERVRIELLNYQVEVFMVLRDLEQACTYLEAAVKASQAISSERRFQESLALFQQMQQLWPSESRIRQLEELFIR